jgi:glycosyltransferase involved in cell wall biosynthesis
MNIYSCLFIEREDSLWHNQLTATLRRMGHKVFIPPEIGLQRSWYISSQGLWTKKDQQELTARIIEDVKSVKAGHGLDLFFCYLFPFQFVPGLFREIGALGIPTAYFFCDNISSENIAKEYAPHATLNWVPESAALKSFESSGSRVIYLPMAANPDMNYPMAVKEIIEISFVGVKNPHRRYMLGKAARSGLKLKIYGSGWERVSEPNEKPSEKRGAGVIRRELLKLMKYGFGTRARREKYLRMGEEYEPLINGLVEKGHPMAEAPYPPDLKHSLEINNIYSLSSVSIGFNDQFIDRRGTIFHTNLRNFEATMSGACYLAQATPDIDQLFSDGKEIMIFHDTDELIDKARFLLKNDAFRRQLKAACRKRALAEHTWEDRFNKLFSALSLKR